MDLLTEAKLERRFRTASTDLKALYAGYYVIELLRLLTDEGDPHPESYDLAAQTIQALDEGEKAADILIPFELRLLRSLGHQPVLSACAGCGKTRTAEGRVSFGLDMGGVLCRQCKIGKRNVVGLSAEAWQYLNSLTNAIAKDAEFEMADWPKGEVRKLMNKYITHLIGFPPKLHRFLDILPKQ